MDKKIWQQNELLKLIKDETMPAIKDEQDQILFARDYENRRVLLDMNILQVLIENNQIEDAIDYLKLTEKVDYISLFTRNENNVFLINVYIKEDMTYLVPIRFETDSSERQIFDDTINCSKEALNHLQKDENFDDDNCVEISSNIVFCPIKNSETDDQFVPLFKTAEETRIIFPRDKYRIGAVTYKEAVKCAKNFAGIVYRPTVESFIISNKIAGLFSAVNQFTRPYKNYKMYTENEKSLEDKIQKIGSMEKGSKEAELYYKGILQNIKDLDKLYVIVSKDDLDIKAGTSIPLALTKDKEPAIYMFSKASYAETWCSHYSYYADDEKKIPLVSEIKSEDDFDSIFKIAKRLGITLCMFNEGQTMMGFNIELFNEVNNCDSEIKLRVNGEDAEKLYTKSGKVNLNFNRCSVMDMKDCIDNTLYYQIKMK